MTDPSESLAVSPVGSVYSNGESFMLAQRMAQQICTSTIVPPAYQGQQGFSNCIVALELSHRMGLSPLAIMQNMQPIHGKPQWTSTFLIALINRCGRFSPLRFAYDNPDAPTSCYAYATELKTGETLRGTTITLQMAQAEGWLNRSGSKWKTMPAQMLMYRAASFWARIYASDLTLGISTTEEIVDVEPVTVREESPMSSTGKTALERARQIRTAEEVENARSWLKQGSLPENETKLISSAVDERVQFLSQPLSDQERQQVVEALDANPDTKAMFSSLFGVSDEAPLINFVTTKWHQAAVFQNLP
ncbi:MAG: hypothetical protein AAFX65_10755 [Cyanobacteria bacterium J06638_7]